MTERYIFSTETAKADMPTTLPFGLSMVGPVIYTFGNEAQKKKFLPRILSGEDWWCQGYSEPGAGSDLASLRMPRRARRRTLCDQWPEDLDHPGAICRLDILPGAHRTNVKPQEGISFLLIDMKSPGITFKPIIVLDGAREVNEVFFDNVNVPVENLVGEENKGWTYAKYLLEHERSGLASASRSRAALDAAERDRADGTE